MRILIIEEDEQSDPAVRHALLEQGIEVDTAPATDDGFATACGSGFDAIVLELKPHAVWGIETCRTLRQHSITTPVLMISTTSDATERVRALNAGADDCLTWPVDGSELTARLRALQRRAQPPTPMVLSYADVELNLATRQVTRSGRRVELTPREFALLEYFLRNPERALNRNELARHVWNAVITSNTIDAYVSLLRRKIDIGFSRRLIQTVFSVGYILTQFL